MNTDKEKLTWKGKTYSNLDELWTEAINWPDGPLNIDDFRTNILEWLRKGEELKNECPKITNRQFYEMIRISTDWVCDPETKLKLSRLKPKDS